MKYNCEMKKQARSTLLFEALYPTTILQNYAFKYEKVPVPGTCCYILCNYLFFRFSRLQHCP